MSTVARHCRACGRITVLPGRGHCPNCNSKLIHCSRYEWFLSDELSHLLGVIGREFRITEQYVVYDHRKRAWYWDLCVWLPGASVYGGYGELIDVQGKRWRRDDDKYWEAFCNQEYHKRGFQVRYVKGIDCKKRAVYVTALEILDDLVIRADEWG